jgi:hypothetical protein
MVAARAARRGRALGEEVETLCARVRELSDAIEQVRARHRAPAEGDPAPAPHGEDPEPGGPRTVH